MGTKSFNCPLVLGMFGDRYDKVDLRNNIYIIFKHIRINLNVCFFNFIYKTYFC